MAGELIGWLKREFLENLSINLIQNMNARTGIEI